MFKDFPAFLRVSKLRGALDGKDVATEKPRVNRKVT